MAVQIKLIKGKEYVKEINSRQLINVHTDHIKKELKNYGTDITKELKRVVSTGTRTGRIYRIKGKSHQASAEGEAPAKLTGRLSNSFRYKSSSWKQLLVGSTAFSDKGFPYPKHLEENMNRPFWDVTNRDNAYKLHRNLLSLRRKA